MAFLTSILQVTRVVTSKLPSRKEGTSSSQAAINKAASAAAIDTSPSVVSQPALRIIGARD